MQTTKVTNITELKTRVGTSNTIVEVLGYNTPGDKSGCSFYWDSANTSLDNTHSVIQVTGVTTGRWVKLEIPKENLDSQYLTYQKRIFEKQQYSTVNFVKNSNFTSSLTNWTEVNTTSSLGGSLVSIETISGKNWLKINCQDASTTPSSRGYVYQNIDIPKNLRYSDLELSFDVFGMFQSIALNTEETLSLNIIIGQDNPERFYYYVNPNGSSTIAIKLYRVFGGQEVSGQYVYYGNIQLIEAVSEVKTISSNVPNKGLNLQLARWVTDWNIAFQERYLKKISKISPFLRVWISSELFANYTLKNSPTKRAGSSGNFSTLYNSTTQAKLFTDFNSQIYKLDWFFDKCEEYGIKLHVCLGSNFTDGQGNSHQTLSLQGVYEFLDSDSDVQTAVIDYFVNVISRIKKYSNIITYELNNEGYMTWRANNAGYNTSAAYSTVRSASYEGYKIWERAAYQAIKAIDNKPITLSLFVNSPIVPQIATDDICDWFTASLYAGAITLTPSNTSSNRFYPTKDYPNVLGDLENGYKVLIYAPASSTLPTGLSANTVYYIVSLASTSFQLSLTSGGSAVTFSGGSGTFHLYSPNGSMIDYDSPTLNALAKNSKFKYLSEFGGPLMTDYYSYRDEDVNSEYIKKIISLQSKYGFESIVYFDEHDLFFDSDFVNTKNTDAIFSEDYHSFSNTILPEKLPNDFNFEGVAAGVIRNIRVIDFDTTGSGAIGAYAFGVKDITSKTLYKEAARLIAYSISNFADTQEFNAPSKIVVEIETGTTSSVMTQVMEFLGTKVVSNKDLSIPSSNLSVGIATAVRKLHAADSSAFVVRIERTGTGSYDVGISVQTPSSSGDLIFEGVQASQGYAFRTRNSANAAVSAFAVDRDGNFVIGSFTPTSTAILDVQSTTKGFLPPRMTTTQINAISSPANGLTVYNTTLNKLCVYENSAWKQVTTTTM